MPRYNDTVMEHFQYPRNVGTLPGATAMAEEVNPVCGDRLRLYLHVEGDRVAEARFQTEGCVGAIAVGSVATELLRGRSVREALALTKEDLEGALGGLPTAKRHATVLVQHAIQRALSAPGTGPSAGGSGAGSG